METQYRSRFHSYSTGGDTERVTEGYQRLLVAVLRRAIWDFALYKDVDPETEVERYGYAVDAAGWIFFDGEEVADEGGRYTFKHICYLLDLDPARVRKQALLLTREDIQQLNNNIKE